MPLSDFSEDLESSDDKIVLYPAEEQSTQSCRLYTKTINTGPKGVLHDANVSGIFDKTKKIEKKEEFIEKSVKFRPTNILNKEILYKHSWGRKQEERESYENSDEKDDVFLNERKTNLKKVIELDCTSFLKIIENYNKVLILIYDESQESTIIKNSFSDIATRYLSIQFAKIFYKEIEMDSVAVPAILGYKNGELVINMMRVIDEICPGKNITGDDLEQILISNSFFT